MSRKANDITENENNMLTRFLLSFHEELCTSARHTSIALSDILFSNHS